MQSRTLPLLVIALACGLGTAYLAWYYAGGNRNDPDVKVLVPKADIKGMTRLNNKDLFKEFTVKQSTLRQGDEYIKTFEEIQEFKSKDYVLAKEKPIYKNDLVKYREVGLGARLLPDEVAQTVRVTPESAVAGFIEVGSRVDIICKVPQQRNDRQGFKTTFQNIEVLAVNQQAGTSPDGQPMPPQSLTLRMKRVDAPKLELYSQLGKVSVVLRKTGYNEIVAVPDVFVGESPTGTNTGEEDGLTPPPATDKGTPPQDPDVPPPPASTAPTPVITPAATQPAPIPDIKPQPAPPPPPKHLKFKTTIVVGDTKKDVDHTIPNPEYKPGEEKDGKVDDRPKANEPAPAK